VAFQSEDEYSHGKEQFELARQTDAYPADRSRPGRAIDMGAASGRSFSDMTG